MEKGANQWCQGNDAVEVGVVPVSEVEDTNLELSALKRML